MRKFYIAVLSFVFLSIIECLSITAAIAGVLLGEKKTKLGHGTPHCQVSSRANLLARQGLIIGFATLFLRWALHFSL